MMTNSELESIISYTLENGYRNGQKKYNKTLTEIRRGRIKGKTPEIVTLISLVLELRKGEIAKGMVSTSRGNPTPTGQPRKLNDTDICEILKMRIAGATHREINLKFDWVSQSHIENITLGIKCIRTDEQKTLLAFLKNNPPIRKIRKQNIATVPMKTNYSNLSQKEIAIREIEAISTTSKKN